MWGHVGQMEQRSEIRTRLQHKHIAMCPLGVGVIWSFHPPTSCSHDMAMIMYASRHYATTYQQLDPCATPNLRSDTSKNKDIRLLPAKIRFSAV